MKLKECGLERFSKYFTVDKESFHVMYEDWDQEGWNSDLTIVESISVCPGHQGQNLDVYMVESVVRCVSDVFSTMVVEIGAMDIGKTGPEFVRDLGKIGFGIESGVCGDDAKFLIRATDSNLMSLRRILPNLSTLEDGG